MKRNHMASARVASDLIYDVGMHNGDDTAFYLHQGFRVIAIDADPRAVDAANRRFHTEVASGRLTILNVGVAEKAGTGRFWISERVSEWNSFQKKARMGEECHQIEVEMQPFGEILDTYGVPFYLKIDIEGNDLLCIEALAGRPLPPFISVEAKVGGAEDELIEAAALRDLPLLKDVGYRRFKLVSQIDFAPELYSDVATFARRLVKSVEAGRLRAPGISRLASHLTNLDRLCRKHRYQFPKGSSGPWGEGTPGKWLSFEQAKAVYEKVRERHLKRANLAFWWDWHATVSPT
jgi:FkbM family methyltransferase